MKSKFHNYLPLLWLLAIPILNICYGFLNHGGVQVWSLMTAFDQSIPFIPAFIIPYLLWYPFIIGMLVLFFLKNKTTYYLTLLSLCVGLILCYIIYYFFQTTVPRPQITIDHGLLGTLVNFVYQTDAPYNCFPSIHVMTSYVILRGLSNCPQISRIIRVSVHIMSWSIILSTLFVKQHVWADIVGAVLLVEIVYYAVSKWMPAKHEQILRKQLAVRGGTKVEL
ncbi:phosphatase PAP2 family protein [Paenibacillus sp. KN14-4R]|uniref:phosphatase PAP2 family protein n=1 Tax=Paenibacillus sp. KN14-4R TaxID=3445773 RepID=UPI003F9EDB74